MSLWSTDETQSLWCDSPRLTCEKVEVVPYGMQEFQGSAMTEDNDFGLLDPLWGTEEWVEQQVNSWNWTEFLADSDGSSIRKVEVPSVLRQPRRLEFLDDSPEFMEIENNVCIPPSSQYRSPTTQQVLVSLGAMFSVSGATELVSDNLSTAMAFQTYVWSFCLLMFVATISWSIYTTIKFWQTFLRTEYAVTKAFVAREYAASKLVLGVLLQIGAGEYGAMKTIFYREYVRLRVQYEAYMTTTLVWSVIGSVMNGLLMALGLWIMSSRGHGDVVMGTQGLRTNVNRSGMFMTGLLSLCMLVLAPIWGAKRMSELIRPVLDILKQIPYATWICTWIRKWWNGGCEFHDLPQNDAELREHMEQMTKDDAFSDVIDEITQTNESLQDLEEKRQQKKKGEVNKNKPKKGNLSPDEKLEEILEESSKEFSEVCRKKEKARVVWVVLSKSFKMWSVRQFKDGKIHSTTFMLKMSFMTDFPAVYAENPGPINYDNTRYESLAHLQLAEYGAAIIDEDDVESTSPDESSSEKDELDRHDENDERVPVDPEDLNPDDYSTKDDGTGTGLDLPKQGGDHDKLYNNGKISLLEWFTGQNPWCQVYVQSIKNNALGKTLFGRVGQLYIWCMRHRKQIQQVAAFIFIFLLAFSATRGVTNYLTKEKEVKKLEDTPLDAQGKKKGRWNKKNVKRHFDPSGGSEKGLQQTWNDLQLDEDLVESNASGVYKSGYYVHATEDWDDYDEVDYDQIHSDLEKRYRLEKQAVEAKRKRARAIRERKLQKQATPEMPSMKDDTKLRRAVYQSKHRKMVATFDDLKKFNEESKQAFVAAEKAAASDILKPQSWKPSELAVGVYKIYRGEQYVCTGTLISNRMIVVLHALSEDTTVKYTARNNTHTIEMKGSDAHILNAELAYFPVNGISTPFTVRKTKVLVDASIVTVYGYGGGQYSEPDATIGFASPLGWCNAKTRDGDCTSPVIDNDGNVVGFWTHGNGVFGRFDPMTTEMIEFFRTTITKNHAGLDFQSGPLFRAN